MLVKQSYHDWKQCLFVDNKQPFTEDFIRQRLTVYENAQHPEYIKFVATYGKEYTLKIISYFKQALNEVT